MSEKAQPQEIKVFCEFQDGFKGDLTHEPVVMNYGVGVLVQILRGINELLLGPVSGLLITISFAFRRRKGRYAAQGLNEESPFEGWRYLFYGVVTFSYSLSLSYHTRLFMSGQAATTAHVLLRNLFSFASLMLFAPRGALKRVVVFGQFVAIISCLVCSIFWPARLVEFYRWEYLFIPLASALVTYNLFRFDPKSRSSEILRHIVFSWTVIQTMDASLLWTGFGAYTAPTVVVFLSLSAFYLRHLEREKTEGIEVAVSRILTAVESQESVDVILRKVALITKEETRFSRVSGYVDSFCLGGADIPRRSFSRVMDFGYSKDTSKDAVISFTDGRGQFMLEALERDCPKLHRGSEGAWFIVVPIGKHACINLSDDRARSTFLAYEGEGVVSRIFLSLRSLDRRLVELGLRQGAALQKIRSMRGDGKWDETVGCAFVDINDYSKYAECFGSAFTTFVSDTYLPALVKAVSSCGAPEHVAGDEVYFVVISDLIGSERTVESTTAELIYQIDRFVFGDGEGLCSTFGFPPISVSMGVNVAQVTVVADQMGARTSGSEVNHAKRLQEEAGKGGILVKANCSIDFGSFPYRIGESFFIQRKKNTILATKIIRNLKTAA